MWDYIYAFYATTEIIYAFYADKKISTRFTQNLRRTYAVYVACVNQNYIYAVYAVYAVYAQGSLLMCLVVASDTLCALRLLLYRHVPLL